MEGQERKLLLEGLLPTDVWNAIIVLLILFGIFVAVFKGYVLIRDEIQKQKARKELKGEGITDQIAAKVSEKITPQIDEKFDAFEKKFDEKFKEIDHRFASNNETIEMHTSQLNAQKDRVDRLDNDTKALLHGMSALLSHQVTGNSIDKLKKTYNATNNYLIDRVYKEESWT